jgi:hypothetical protein
MKKKVLVVLIVILIAVSVAIFSKNVSLKSTSAKAKSSKLLCDSGVACNHPDSKQIPKGVCVPGGLCT